MTTLQTQLREQTDSAHSLSEQLNTAKTRLQELLSQSEEKDKTVHSLTQEVNHLTQAADGLREEVQVSSSVLVVPSIVLGKIQPRIWKSAVELPLKLQF